MIERTEIEEVYVCELEGDLRFLSRQLCLALHRQHLRPERIVCVIYLKETTVFRRIEIGEIYLDDLDVDLRLLIRQLRFLFNRQNVQTEGIVCSICSEEVDTCQINLIGGDDR